MMIRIDQVVRILGEELVVQYEGMDVIHPAYTRILKKLRVI